jgi:anti-sigma factor RsiW
MDGHLTDALSALLDGELTPAEAAGARGHLATCAFCTSELSAIDRIRSRIRALPAVDPPVALTSAMPVTPAPPVIRRRRPVAAMAAGIAAAAAVVLLQLAPVERQIAPEVTRLVEVHATSGVNNDPTQLAPAAVPVDFRRP